MAGKLVRGVSFISLSQLARMAARGGLVLILTRYLLEPTEYGLLFLALSVLGIVMLFANLGLTKAGARYITEYRETSPELVPTVLRKILLYNSVLIAVVCVALFLFNERIAALVGEPAIALLLLVGTAFVATKSFHGDAVYFFHGFNRMDGIAAVNVVSSLLLLAAVPGFVLLGYGLEGALAGYALAYGVAAAAGLAVIYRRFYADHDVDAEAKREVRSRLVRYSAPLTLTMGSNVVNSHVDRILLSVFRGPAAIAFYTLGKQITGFLIVPARSLGFGISPTYGERKANDEMARAADTYERAFVYTVAIYAPAAVGIVLVADPTVRLIFGADYAGAVPVLQIFSLFLFVRALDAITNDALDYMGRARARATAKGFLTVGNVVLNLLLVPPFGVVGAAVATVATYTVYVGAELYVIADELPIDPVYLLRSGLVVCGITVGMSALVYPLTGFISGLPSLAGVVGLGGAAWFVLTVVTGVVDLRRLYAALH